MGVGAPPRAGAGAPPSADTRQGGEHGGGAARDGGPLGKVDITGIQPTRVGSRLGQANGAGWRLA